MLFVFAYLLLRRAIRLFTRSSYDVNSDLEVVVLRHQLMVLRRQLGKPHLRRRDRLFVAAVSRRSHELAGRRSWSVLRRCFDGIASSSGGSGPGGGARPAAGHPSARRSESSSCGWAPRTPGGGVLESGAN